MTNVCGALSDPVGPLNARMTCVGIPGHLDDHRGITGWRWPSTPPDVAETMGTLIAADTLCSHHPVRRSPDGPITGCDCGALQLGESWSWHVVTALTRAGVRL